MSLNYRTEEYYKKFIELQEKLRKSEEERLKLEMKFNEMAQVTKEETQAHYRKLRTQYKRFLEEDGRRQDRNERIMRSLDRIDSRLAMLRAKTERFQLLRQQYHYFLDRIYKVNRNKTASSELITSQPEIKIDPPTNKSESFSKTPIQEEQPPYSTPISSSSRSDLLIDHYIQNLSSQKIRDLLVKEETARSRLPFSLPSDKNNYSSGYEKPSYNNDDLYNFGDGGEVKPNYANSVADDIMNSIYSRPKQKFSVEFDDKAAFSNNGNEFNLPETNKKTMRLIDDLSDKKKSPVEDSDMDSEWSEAESVKAVNRPENDLDTVDPEQSIPPNIELGPPKMTSIKPESPEIIQETQSVSHQPEVAVIKNTPAKMVVEDETPELVNKLLADDEKPQEKVSSTDSSIKEIVASEIQHPQENVELKPTSPSESAKLEKVEETLTPIITSVPEKIEKAIIDQQPAIETQPSDENYQQEDQQYAETANPEQYYDQSDQMYDENGQPVTSYDQYDESGQLVQQYNDQQYQYDEQGEVVQQYDENGKPIITPHYDENAQSVQQYDATGYDQSYPQYDENGQLIQQYDENGQPIQPYYPDQSQLLYDENGQPIIQDQQYDESGQPIQQYDESGQPIQQYYGGYEQQYDENGQPIQQYDENGQPITQQYDYTDQQYALQDYPEDQPDEKVIEENPGLLAQNLENIDQPQFTSEKIDDMTKPLVDPTRTDDVEELEDKAEIETHLAQNVESSEQPEITSQKTELDVSKGSVEFNEKEKVEELKEESVTEKKTPNVMDMLDTDTESAKQDTKISNDSDFDFSNE